MFEKTKAILRKFNKATNGTLESEFESEVIRKINIPYMNSLSY